MEEEHRREIARWRRTAKLLVVAGLLTLLTIFIAGNFTLVEVRIFFLSAQMRLAWSLLLAAGLGFGAGLFMPGLRG